MGTYLAISSHELASECQLPTAATAVESVAISVATTTASGTGAGTITGTGVATEIKKNESNGPRCGVDGCTLCPAADAVETVLNHSHTTAFGCCCKARRTRHGYICSNQYKTGSFCVVQTLLGDACFVTSFVCGFVIVLLVLTQIFS